MPGSRFRALMTVLLVAGLFAVPPWEAPPAALEGVVAQAETGAAGDSVADRKARARDEAAEVALTRAGERDRIFSLLAYALTLEDWQEGPHRSGTGYNIAAVLVDENDVPVAWARNAVHATGNFAQHAELRVILCHLASSNRKTLWGYTLYTTLESCVMCTGAAYITRLRRIVYGQTDPDFGGVVERLAMDTRGLAGGHRPYPRHLVAEGSSLYHRYWLDLLYDDYQRENSRPRLTAFLRSDQAREVFEDALRALTTYDVVFPGNASVLASALEFLGRPSAADATECLAIDADRGEAPPGPERETGPERRPAGPRGG